MGKYVKTAEAHEIPENKMKVFKIENHEILIVNVEGELHAVENRCSHMGYPLYLGNLKGKMITCGFHYAKFDVTTGKSLSQVTAEPLKTLNVKVQNSRLLVEI